MFSESVEIVELSRKEIDVSSTDRNWDDVTFRMPVGAQGGGAVSGGNGTAMVVGMDSKHSPPAASKHKIASRRTLSWLPLTVLLALSLQACGGSSSNGIQPDSGSTPDPALGDGAASTPTDTTGSPTTNGPVGGSPSLPSNSDSDPQIIVTTPATPNDLIPDTGGMLYNGYDNAGVVVIIPNGVQPPTTEVLRTEIGFTGDQLSPNLRVERMFTVTRHDVNTLVENEVSGDDAYVDIVGIVTNISDTVQCGISIQLDSASLADGTTRAFRFGSLADVSGAVGDNILDNPPSDCIFPATSVYFYFDDPRPVEGDFGSFRLTHGDVLSVNLSPFRSQPRTNLTFETGIISYSLTMDRSAEFVFIQNTGDFGFELTGSIIYALDGSGLPLGARQISDRHDDIRIAPGEIISLFNVTRSFDTLFSEYRSSVDKYLIVVSYDDL